MRNSSRTTGTNGDSFRRFEVITGVGRRRRWSVEEKARIVAESLDPATTASAVARRYRLHASQLFEPVSRSVTEPSQVHCNVPKCRNCSVWLQKLGAFAQRNKNRMF